MVGVLAWLVIVTVVEGLCVGALLGVWDGTVCMLLLLLLWWCVGLSRVAMLALLSGFVLVVVGVGVV
ncbi:hypothetical protein CLAC_12155 [Corynebacterium lactis RW2-5]|uniref:Uncharacterized protein n=1 Tax=Corynebacterium lactis RW2-5 TaxID=1408189 RepID=A0A0K2H3X5_9CORY|nr:hypothetical protein CLAC_12155 [Corynebacterium lactis RW2-5]